MLFCKVLDDRARVLRSTEKFVGIYPDTGLKRTDNTVDGCQQQGHPPPQKPSYLSPSHNLCHQKYSLNNYFERTKDVNLWISDFQFSIQQSSSASQMMHHWNSKRRTKTMPKLVSVPPEHCLNTPYKAIKKLKIHPIWTHVYESEHSFIQCSYPKGTVHQHFVY